MEFAHPGLIWLQGEEGGPEWLASLPRLVEACVEKWDLELREPFPYACVSLVFPCTTPDGSDAVLKMQFPYCESEQEATALDLWDGDGAVHLLSRDQERNALLLERCIPGTGLQVDQDLALDVYIGLLPRLWKPAGPPFQPLTAEATRWVTTIPKNWERTGRNLDRRLVDAAVDVLPGLAESQGAQVLLNQDLHGGNVLRAEREEWLVIDPKPLVGEREFSVASIVRAFDYGREKRDMQHRFDRLTDELGLDRDRARMWAFAQTVALTFDAREEAYYTNVANWLLDGNP